MKILQMGALAALLSIAGCAVQREPRGGREPIMGRDGVGVAQMERFVLRHNPAADRSQVRRLADIYRKECKAEGVRASVAFCQMCLETNFLAFTGDVSADQNNFCGYGATGGGRRGVRFPSLESGVRAQVQHLKAYATSTPTRRRCIDGRRKLVALGSAPYVNDLSGQWAADPSYGAKICRLLRELCNE
ncbi:MAG: glucosaminidase domain-containing protein [Puniceicoccales bacterium]|nr:glucosaminidase domain-containing protein [Puniceicoccales bacterium]